MKLLLKRTSLNENYTIGKLFIDGVYTCDTIEDAVREEKIKGATAIPYGTYDVILTMSNRFKKVLPLLLHVPNFDGVRIHSGNTQEDTEGCILCGKNSEVGKVVSSRLYTAFVVRAIEKAIKNNDSVSIQII